MEHYQLLHGDVMAMLADIPNDSVDSVVTDPPYELGFMGKAWDSTGIAYSVPMWKEVFRVLKPGGHLLSFGGSRTYHRMASAVEDAGFEIRDQIMWVYGQGFPKSMDVSKAIDKAAGAERVCTREGVVQRGGLGEDWDTGSSDTRPRYDKPATEAATQWSGWGTSLKPTHEPLVVARKPLIGTVAANVLKHGTGAINIGACRIPGEPTPINKLANWSGFGEEKCPDYTATMNNKGRWPANLVHDGSDEVTKLFPDTGKSTGGGRKNSDTFGGGYAAPGKDTIGFGDSGSAARFFYCPKSNKKDRNEGCESLPNGNNHTTVKPTDLMRYLVRLVTPPSGTVLDPLMGSGSTGKAALLEGFKFIGIDKEENHVAIAEARLSGVANKTQQLTTGSN